LHSPAHQTLTQRLAFDQFTGNVMGRVILADLVNRQDIWMIEPNQGARFLLKPLQALRIAGKAFGQEFERGLAARCYVGGQIDVAHPAGADPFRNFVVADRATDEQISLPVLDNASSKTGDWGFNEGVCSLMRSEECFNFTTHSLITFA